MKILHLATLASASSVLAFSAFADKGTTQNQIPSATIDVGQVDNGEPAFGTLYFNPVEQSRSGQDGSNSAQRIEITFAPVQQDADGTILSQASDETVYRSSFRPDAQGNLRPNKAADIQALDMPAGRYAITEIKYLWNDNRSPSQSVSAIRSTKYCLSGDTVTFDLENGKSHFLGTVKIETLPQNSSQLIDHNPLLEIVSTLDTARGLSSDDSVQLLDITREATFSKESGLCGRVKYHTAALVD